MIVDTKAFEAIVKREEDNKSRLPPHTLDWYIYDNRVTLLNEVRALFEDLPEIQAVVTIVEPVKKRQRIVQDTVPQDYEGDGVSGD